MISAAVGELGGWRSRTTFVLVLAAGSVGLGSLWRFAWLMGSHGGGAFMLTYIVCLFLVAVPVCCAEITLGMTGRAAPVLSIRRAATASGASPAWMLLGLAAALTGFVLAGCQAVVAGWSLGYLNLMRGEVFAAASVQEVAARFRDLLGDTAMQIRWQTAFIALLAGILALGVRRGLGLLAWMAVPLMMVLLGTLVRFSLQSGDLASAGAFLFSTRLVDFDAAAVLAALGHALLSLATGVGAVITFGAYAPQRIPIGRSVMAVALFDTALALLAGLAIVPVAYANNVEPTGGPGLAFIAAPYTYGNVIHGEFFGVLFFALMAVAALGAAAALLEPTVALLVQHLRLTRPAAAILAALGLGVLAWVVAASMADGGWHGYRNLLAQLDFLAGRVLLPSIALLLAILVGWVLKPVALRPHMVVESDLSFSLWRFILRYITPPAVAAVLVAGLYL